MTADLHITETNCGCTLVPEFSITSSVCCLFWQPGILPALCTDNGHRRELCPDLVCILDSSGNLHRSESFYDS